MKDAKGNGSDPHGAHASGVEKVGKLPMWYAQGQHLNQSALMKVNEDADQILEPKEWGYDWRLTDVPIASITSGNVPVSDPVRLASLRAMGTMSPIILSLAKGGGCLLYTSPSPRDGLLSRMPSSA